MGLAGKISDKIIFFKKLYFGGKQAPVVPRPTNYNPIPIFSLNFLFITLNLHSLQPEKPIITPSHMGV
jgi:hypothetical protein